MYGNNAEIQALSEMYNRPIHIYSYSTGASLLAAVDFYSILEPVVIILL